MSSRRCSICSIDWPSTQAFKNCPDCGQATWVNPDGEPQASYKPPRVNIPLPPHEIEIQVREFAAWLDTICPDDFKKTT